MGLLGGIGLAYAAELLNPRPGEPPSAVALTRAA